MRLYKETIHRPATAELVQRVADRARRLNAESAAIEAPRFMPEAIRLAREIDVVLIRRPPRCD